jgi:hypothetical protein
MYVNPGIYRKPTSGAGGDELVAETGYQSWPCDWSAAARFLLLMKVPTCGFCRWTVTERRFRWRRDGPGMFYLAADGDLMSVSIGAQPEFARCAEASVSNLTDESSDSRAAAVRSQCPWSTLPDERPGQRVIKIKDEATTFCGALMIGVGAILAQAFATLAVC